MVVYRYGVANATTAERQWLLYAERYARNLASQQEYQRRCADPSYSDADLRAIAINSSVARWVRAQRRLFIVVRVRVGGRDGVLSYRWRTPVLRGPGARPDPGGGPGLLTRGSSTVTLRRRAGVGGRLGSAEPCCLCRGRNGERSDTIVLVWPRRLPGILPVSRSGREPAERSAGWHS